MTMDIDKAPQLDAADPLSSARERFSLPDGIIYLDGNSLGALPRTAPAALVETAERQWGDDLIASWTKHGWIDWPVRIGAKLAPIVGAKPSELPVQLPTRFELVVNMKTAKALNVRFPPNLLALADAVIE